VNRLAVWQQNHPQKPVAHLGDWGPAANSAIRLNLLANRVGDDMLNPFVSD
jgi:hypothetical protein